jgi:hypothetical protein
VCVGVCACACVCLCLCFWFLLHFTACLFGIGLFFFFFLVAKGGGVVLVICRLACSTFLVVTCYNDFIKPVVSHFLTNKTYTLKKSQTSEHTRIATGFVGSIILCGC